MIIEAMAINDIYVSVRETVGHGRMTQKTRVGMGPKIPSVPFYNLIWTLSELPSTLVYNSLAILSP